MSNNVVSGNNTTLALYAPVNTQTNACNNSPSFVNRYTPYLCVNETHNIRFIATDLEGDSLVYSLVPALTSSGLVSHVTGLSGTEQMAGITINPFSGSTRIEVAGTDEYDLVVFDIAGKKVLEVQGIRTPSYQLNSETLGSGMYFTGIFAPSLNMRQVKAAMILR